MANITINRIPIDSFFEFADGVSPFDLIDIVSESETYGNHTAASTDEFEYRTHFFINQRVSEELGADGLRVEIFTANPKENKKLTSTSAIASFEVNFDIATDILSKKNATQKPGLFSLLQPQKVLVAANARSVGAARLVIPGQQGPETQSFSAVSKKLKSMNVDPASMASAGNFFAVTPKNAISLDSSNNAQVSQTHVKTQGSNIRSRKSLSAARNANRSSRRGGQSNDLVRTIEPPSAPAKISNTAYISLLPKKRPFIQNLCIKRGSITGADKLYAKITIIPGRKATGIFGTKTVEIQHGTELSEFLSNPEPPDVSIVSSNAARVKIRIFRTDKTLKNVRVARIITNVNTSDVLVTDVGDLSFGADDTLIFDDFINNALPRRILYRVVVINGDGSAGEFSSITIPSFKKVSDPLRTAGVPVSIRAINKPNVVDIRVTTLLEGVYTIRLLRQELDKTGEFSNSITVIPSDVGETTTVVNGDIDSFEFRDKTAILGRKYRYFVAYRIGLPGYASRGEEILSDEDELLIRRYATSEIPFAVSVSEPTVKQDNNNITTVSFEIRAEETRDLFNTVTQALRAAGVDGDFIASLQKDNIKAKLFTMFLVERFEFSSGRRETFGLYPAGDFTDSPEIRKLKKISPPKPGDRYEYIVKTCLQQPEVFLQTSNVALVNRHGDEIKRKGSRFSRIVYDKLGVMPSEHDVQAGKSIESLVLESQIGLEQSVYSKIPTTTPTIESFQVKEKSFYNSLSWQVSGDTKNVSYFLVYCSSNGKNQLCGAVAATKSSSLYRFRDDRFFDEVGEKSYDVRIINFNDDETVKSVSISSNKLFSVPKNLIEDFSKSDAADFSDFQQLVSNSDSSFIPIADDAVFDWSQIDLPSFSKKEGLPTGKKPKTGFISDGSSATANGSEGKTLFESRKALLDANQEVFDDDEKKVKDIKSLFF